MNKPNDGFPPGFNVGPKRTGNERTVHEDADARSKQAKAWAEARAQMPRFTQGDPLDTHDGILQVPPQGQAISPEAMQALGMTPMTPEMEAYANRPDEDFAAPPPPVYQQPPPKKQVYGDPVAARPKATNYQQPAPEEPRTEVNPPTFKKVADAKYDHPVVRKMLEKFGITRPEIFSTTIYNSHNDSTKYSMTVLPEDVSLWAISEAQARIPELGESVATAWFQLLIAATAVVAIDDTPTYELFRIPLTAQDHQELAEHPMYPPKRVRKQAGLALATLLWGQTNNIGDKLYEYYTGRVSKAVDYVSSYDQEIRDKKRFRCPIEGCTEFLLENVRLDGKSYFCKFHGTPMVMEVDGAFPLE